MSSSSTQVTNTEEKPYEQLYEYTIDNLPDVRDTGQIIYVTKEDGKKYIAVTDGAFWKINDKPI